MNRYARHAASKSIRILSTDRPFSNFDFIEQTFGNSYTLPRLMSQVRCQGAKVMVFEELRPSADLKEENNDIQTLLGQKFGSQTFRLSFFARKFRGRDGVKSLTNEHFIGYAIVVKRDVPSGKKVCVYESVIRKSPYPNNFIHGEPVWTCSVDGVKFQIKGYPYAEQNGLTNVCAHAALRTATSRFGLHGGVSYGEINKIVGINHKSKKAGNGLEANEIVKVLERSGARCFVADFTTNNKPPAPYHKYIYGSIESGFPVIVFFGTSGSADSYHVISVFGHTFNRDTWVPNADRSYFKIGRGTRYIPSDAWLSMFIGHDDNLGSNLCIPRHYLQSKRHAKSSTTTTSKRPVRVGAIAYIIATVPRHIKLSPIHAEVIGADYLFTILPQLPGIDDNKWVVRLLKYARESQLVLRPILVSGRQYVRHLEMVSDWAGKRINKSLIRSLKEPLFGTEYWLIELSVPELFSANQRKVGEVLLRADRKLGAQRDMGSFVLARLPGYFAVYQGGGAQSPKYLFASSGADGHVELFGCEQGASD